MECIGHSLYCLHLCYVLSVDVCTVLYILLCGSLLFVTDLLRYKYINLES